MYRLTLDQLSEQRGFFRPEQPGPLIASHVLASGVGEAWADRLPNPRAVVAHTGTNWSLRGDPAVVDPRVLDREPAYVEAPVEFEDVLREAFPELRAHERVIYALRGAPHAQHAVRGVRRLDASDAETVAALGEDVVWIAKTWGGPAGLAASATAHGAFVDGRLVAVACPFFCGERFEDLGVVTGAAFRGRGLVGACAQAVCTDVIARGRVPTWTTTPANAPSVRVAEKLGFALDRRDVLYVSSPAVEL